MTIIQQCVECNKIGKNSYCINCIKSIDYFNVIRYNNNNNNRFADGEAIGKIKAYTWHDAIEFIKNNFYHDQNNLDINCEKEFAFVEQKPNLISKNNGNKKEEDFLSYKIYLNKDGKNELNLSPLSGKNIWDATIINNT
ncbi:MAG: hypothetical protein ABJB76_12730 [Candidatus Nitrosocosmicus sp.]